MRCMNNPKLHDLLKERVRVVRFSSAIKRQLEGERRRLALYSLHQLQDVIERRDGFIEGKTKLEREGLTVETHLYKFQ